MIPALRYQPADGRPETVIGGPLQISAAIVGAGLLTAGLANGVIIGALWLVAGAMSVVGDSIDDDAPERLLEEEDVIEARFVTLGREFEEELPNREVPLLDTAPPQPAEVPTDDTPVEQAEEREEQEEPPPDAVEDELLRDVLNRSQVFAEIAEEREREGSPDGIEEGTEQEGTEGDIYRGRLYSFFRRGWSLPTTMSRDEAQDLQATADVQIGENLELVSFEIRRSSDNPLFDQSILEQLTRLQAADQRIPPPPEDEAERYIGTHIVVRFSGRQAR